MSAIQDKIKQLQRQQAKIDLLQSVKADLQKLTDPEGHEGIAAEVRTLVETVITTVVSKLESGETFGNADRAGIVHLTSEENSTLRKISSGGTTPLDPGTRDLILRSAMNTETQESAPPPRPKADKASHDEKIAFAIQHRALGGKKVKGITDEGHPVEGPVIKLDAPFILVRNDLSEGDVTPVRPENLEF